MPSSRAASQLISVSSMNRQRLGVDPVEPRERQLVDLRLGLAHPDEAGVDDDLEDLVERAAKNGRQSGSHSTTLLVSSAIR